MWGSGGATIELAQIESMIAVLGDRVAEAQMSGTAVPSGNRDDAMRAQGVYRCAGDDSWVAVSVVDQAAWSALSTHAGLAPGLIDDHDAFDAAFGTWVADREAGDVAAELQSIGVAAAPVNDAPAVMADPHLAARGLFVTIDQPEVGPFTVPVTPIHLSHTPPVVRRPAPRLGEHNAEVLGGMAGFSADRVSALHASGVIVDEPPN